MQPRRDSPQPPPNDLAWRAEIRERVRALRAKRELEAELALAMSREKGREKSRARQLRLPIETAIPTRPLPVRQEHPVVQAALKRLERAHPSMASQPAALPSTMSSPVSSISVGRGTAAALAPMVEAPREVGIPPGTPHYEPSQNELSVPIASPRELTRMRPETAEGASLDSLERYDIDSKLEELLDFDPAIFNDAAPLRLRMLGGAVDLLALAITCVPFLALAELADANYRDPLTRTMIVVMLASVLVGYFAIAVGVTGKTVGMHFAGIRVVDYLSRLQPNFVQTTLRAFGYLFAAAPLMAGLVWILIDDEHRGWHDHISSTAVVQDH